MKRAHIILAIAALLTGAGVVAAVFSTFSAQGDGPFKDLDPSLRLGLHLGLGENAFEAGQYSIAEGEFTKALAVAGETGIATDRAECLTRLGQSYSRLGKTAEARGKLREAYEVYAKAGDEFIFTVDKRVKKQCLEEYARVLEKSGDRELARTVSEEHQKLREEFGPLEKVREKMQQF